MKKIRLATPAVLLLAGLVLLSPALLPSAGRADSGSAPAAAAGARTAQDWAQTLAAAHAKLEAARAKVTSAQAAVDEARHRHWPRGDALAKLEKDLADAKQELATREADWPELLGDARRAGVPAEVLRPYED